MDNKIHISHKINKEKEGTYYTVPFTVPEGIESFTVRYSYEKVSQGLFGKNQNACVVDLGITDCDGKFIGWSGSAKASVTVGEFSSTNGYFCRPIKQGTWYIIVGAYKINKNEITVDYEIEFTKKHKRFFYGDLHMHSTASDGQFTVPELAAKAKAMGLDFIAVADHNNYCENFSLPRVPDLTLIPAVEWTHYKGHMNFFGVAAPFDNSFIANSAEEMENLINDVKRRGAVVSVNHPECDVCPYLWDNDEIYDMIEIWNGPMRSVNVRGIRKWTELLKTGRKIPAVGGSDFHRTLSPVRMGNPVNAVYTDSPSAEALLEAIKSGHLSVASSKKAPTIMLKCRDKIMGDTVQMQNTTEKITVEVENKGSCKLIAVSADGEKELTADSVSVSAKDKFLYVKALKGGIIKAVSNPIYLETK